MIQSEIQTKIILHKGIEPPASCARWPGPRVGPGKFYANLVSTLRSFKAPWTCSWCSASSFLWFLIMLLIIGENSHHQMLTCRIQQILWKHYILCGNATSRRSGWLSASSKQCLFWHSLYNIYKYIVQNARGLPLDHLQENNFDIRPNSFQYNAHPGVLLIKSIRSHSAGANEGLRATVRSLLQPTKARHRVSSTAQGG